MKRTTAFLLALLLLGLTALPSLAQKKLPPPFVHSIILVDYTEVGYGWCVHVRWRHVDEANDYYVFIQGKKGLMPRHVDGLQPEPARWRPRIWYNGAPGHNDHGAVCKLDENQKVKFRVRAVDTNAANVLKSGKASAPFVFELPAFGSGALNPQYGVPTVEIFKSVLSG